MGIALALHGLRARGLNVGCVGISLAMNALAAAPGWRDLAVWGMPAAVYALASDTLIGVVHTRAVARTSQAGQQLTDEDATPMAIVGGLIMWLLRLTLASPSTLTGFRHWALAECPVAPGRKAPPASTAPPQPSETRRPPQPETAGR